MPRWTVALILAATASVFLALWWFQDLPPSTAPPSAVADLSPPKLSPARFLNTGSEAHYIGIAACKECHAGNHASYLLTAHSRSLSRVDPQTEPPDGAFQHGASGHSYRIYRAGDEFRHEESMRSDNGREIARIDVPIRYLVGSGHFTRSYIAEIDGFMHESPITWYASRQSWRMSPGYDSPRHQSFERSIMLGCLACHAGRVEPDGDAVHRIKILESAIGCESCHGPGSLHADRRRKVERLDGDDLTIVNVGKLSRDDQESVCATCHLTAAATSYLRGRRITDFRPGQPLSDYRVDYRYDVGSEQMTVVGHMEQLRRSACYRKSAGLSCLTCHDPHAKELPRDSTAFYRGKCLTCHTPQACKLAPADRLKKEPADSCIQCHMPRGDTDIPHIAFTHHRIGAHGPKPSTGEQRVPELIPIGDVSHLSEVDRQRNLGLAYLEAIDVHAKTPAQVQAFRERARQNLEAVVRADLHDAATEAGLARIYWDDGNHSVAARSAQRALDLGASEMRADAHANTLLLLAHWHMVNKENEKAVGLLEKVTALRRHSNDWRVLGLVYLELNQLSNALEALKHAEAIRPWRPDVHAGLAKVYAKMGDSRRASEQEQTARWLTQKGQR